MDDEKPATITASPGTSGMKSSLYMGLTTRQLGFKPGCNALPVTFEAAAEDQLVSQKTYADTKCALPASTRSTFLMVFSPDGKLVASTHGDHCVYVCDVATGACVRTLAGHPRTPWCLAFHPTSSQLLASGCLGGQVRVWDLSGGSEMWCADEQTVIASLAFHPSSDRLLVIATYNELLFWDWSKPKPFAKCSTRCEKEKVRFVTFDPLGHKLITGIANRLTPPSQWDQQSATFFTRQTSSATSNSRDFQQRVTEIEMMQEHLSSLASRNNAASAAAAAAVTASGSSSGSWEWTTPFSNLLQEYETLVQRCRQRMGNPTDNTPNRVDRGTNTQESGSSTSTQQDSTSTQTTPSTVGGSATRLNTYVQCIASLDEQVATTNIERLRNPLAPDHPVAQTHPTIPEPSTSTATSQTPNSLASLTIPCSVNLGERVSEEGLRRLREMWRAGTSHAPSTSCPTSAATATTVSSSSELNRSPSVRLRRRRRLMTPFDSKRETKRLRCDLHKKESSTQRSAADTNSSTTSSSSSSSQSSPQDVSISDNTTSSNTEVPISRPSAVGTNASSSIYDDPQPGTSNAREPEVILILSDSDSSSDSFELASNRTVPTPVIDVTSSTRSEADSAYRNRLERRMRLLQMLNRNPRTPMFLQTSQQSAFRPQTPRSGAADSAASSAPPTRRTPSVPRFLRASADLGVRYAIRMLSRHIDLMERRCRARLEILQLEQIRRLWEEFMTQLSSLNSTLSSNISRREGTTEEVPSTSRNEEDLWLRREDLDMPSTSHDTSERQQRSESQALDREAAAAVEDAYIQISEDPPIDEVIAMFDTPGTSNSSTSSSRLHPTVILPNLPGLNERASLSGQVPEDGPLEDSTQNFSTARHTINYRGSSSSSRSASNLGRASRTSINNLRGRPPTPSLRSSNDSSEEYHITLLRANQISVLRRLLTLLEHNDFPLEALATGRSGSQEEQRRSTTQTNRDSEPRPLSQEQPAQQSRPDPPDRNSPTAFLEELRSIQQSIVERYDHMLEIPSQEAMQRDLDRIVNLEAAVRERLRLSEDNYERSLLDNQEAGSSPSQPTVGSPWSRETPSRTRLRRVDPLDNTLFYWGPDNSNPRESQDDTLSSSNSFHSRLNQPFLFRPPPEPLMDERPESQRESESSEEWQQNANLLQTTRRQAWRVLGLMVRHVRQHIELHQLERFSEGSALQTHLQQLLSLLHRALELTDTLLTQMLATRREMENQWRQRLRPTPGERPGRIRRVWQHPLRYSVTPSSASGSNFSQTMSTWRERDSMVAGMYLQEMHRRGVSDTDPVSVNHLIQHFQRRTPDQTSQGDSLPGNTNQNASSNQSGTVDNDRSQQLRQRLGGLWTCRRSPLTQTQSTTSSSSRSSTQNLPSIIDLNTPTVIPASPVENTRASVSQSRVPLVPPTNGESARSTRALGTESPSIYDSIRSRYNRVCTILDRLTRLDPSPQFRSWAENLRRLLEMPQRYFEAEDERQRIERRQSAFNVPSVRVNDVPINDAVLLNQFSRAPQQPTSPPIWTRRRAVVDEPAAGGSAQRSRSPSPVLGRVRAGAWRSWMYYPRNRGMPTSARDLFGASHQATMEGIRGSTTACPTTLTHRIQCWPFMEGYIPPDISNSHLHLVVASCRINNDASVDVSRDGRLLVALVPSPRPGGHSKLGIYSLETSTLGQMLFSTALDQSPVSVSLSPSSRFLLVGLATKRFLTVRGESSPAAQVFRLPWEKQGRKDAPACITLDATRYIYQTNEIGYVSINCIRWAPIAGQGMVYATNTGNLGILR